MGQGEASDPTFILKKSYISIYRKKDKGNTMLTVLISIGCNYH